MQTGPFRDSHRPTEIVFDPNQNCKPSFIQGLAMMSVLVSCPPEGSSPGLTKSEEGVWSVIKMRRDTKFSRYSPGRGGEQSVNKGCNGLFKGNRI